MNKNGKDKNGKVEYSGKAKVTFCRKLGASWHLLCTTLEIPEDESVKFRKGEEGLDILSWLEQRTRRQELPDALIHIGRQDLVTLFHPTPPTDPGLQSTEPLWRKGSPYPGLMTFSEDYAPVFCGRQHETETLLDRLKVPKNRFIAILGASGSGKSSLVTAGLLPRLKDNALPGSRNWIVIEFTPGQPHQDPFPALSSPLVPLLKSIGLGQREIDRKLRAKDGFRTLVAKARSTNSALELLLFIDQFEELFTICKPAYQAPFIGLLDEAAKTPGVRIILTLRSDFFPHCLRDSRLTALLNAGQYSLSTPSVLDLHEMITRPAALAGLRFNDPELPLDILNDTGAGTGSLPLIAAALRELYENRGPDNTLTREAYKKLGGVQGVIEKIADQAYANLDKEAQNAFGEVFKELVQVEPEQRTATRKHGSLDHFKNSPAALKLIRRFTEARLLVCDKDRVEVAHEALLVHWEKLKNWIDVRLDDFRLLWRLRLDAAEWEKRGFPDNDQWPHERMKEVVDMLENLEMSADDLPPLVREFLGPIDPKQMLEDLKVPETTHEQRATIGIRLAVFGDPRKGVGLREDGLPDIDWCQIPEGEVTLEEDAGTFPVKACYMAKYPVTWIQYQAFVEAEDGFCNSNWWDGLYGKHENPSRQLSRRENHPAENISWLDAIAFCRWLTEKLGYAKEIRLPTEWEWQQAATGGNPDNQYPWGAEWKEGLANTYESELNRAIAVGMYPLDNASTCPMDIIGNLLEWCLNKYDAPESIDLAGEDRRVLRGGSWGGDQDIARAAYRNRSHPGTRNDVVGFRLLCEAPIF